MDAKIKSQAASGLRLGLGAGAFLIAGTMLSFALPRLISSTPGGVAWFDWMAWAEIVLAFVLLAATADVWFLLVAGLALFGFVKSLLTLVVGEELYHRQPVPRPEAAAATLFALATLFLMFRFKNNRPGLLDRLALATYVLGMDWYAHSSASTFVNPWLIGGLGALFVSWCVDQWKKKPKMREGLSAP